MEHEAITNIKRKSNKVKALFKSGLGVEVIDILTEEFDKADLRGATVEETYFNLGRRDVLVYLMQLLEVDGIE